MAETNPPPADQAGLDPVTAVLAALPWYYAQSLHAIVEGSCRFWAHIVLRPAFPPHPHEAESQLEIPGPIAAELEQDLFA